MHRAVTKCWDYLSPISKTAVTKDALIIKSNLTLFIQLFYNTVFQLMKNILHTHMIQNLAIPRRLCFVFAQISQIIIIYKVNQFKFLTSNKYIRLVIQSVKFY